MGHSLKSWFGKRSLLYQKINNPDVYIPLLVRFLIAGFFHRSPVLFDFIAGPLNKDLPRETVDEIARTSERFFSSSQRHKEFQDNADPFGMVYQDLLDKKVRMEQGEFYTPFPLALQIAERLLDLSEHQRISGSSLMIPSVNSFEDRSTGLFSKTHDVTSKENAAADYSSNSIFGFSIDSAYNSKSEPIRLLDPACGSGVFLIAALTLLRRRENDPQKLLNALFGLDLNPLAVLMTKGNLFLELFKNSFSSASCIGSSDAFSGSDDNEKEDLSKSLDSFIDQCQRQDPFQIFHYDSILCRSPSSPKDIFSFHKDLPLFDLVLGNPPWICWDQLSLSDREKTKPLWRRYGLFDLSGKEARYGGGKKDLASLMFYVCADRFLKERGFLSMIVPLSLLKNDRAGQGFRRFQIGQTGPFLKVIEINDYSRCSLFKGIQSPVSSLAVQKGKETEFPVPCRFWKDKNLTSGSIGFAVPVDPENKTSSFLFSEGRKAADNSSNQSRQYYVAQLGANTAGANGVFWFSNNPVSVPNDPNLIQLQNLADCGKRKIESLKPVLEKELFYPLLRWKDVKRFCARPSARLLLVQDPYLRQGIPLEKMKQKYPNTLKYLLGFENILRSRAAYQKFQAKAPFWSMYNINEKTLSPIKVIWRRMDWQITAAVLLTDEFGRPIIPQETFSMIAVETIDEADYLAAVLNSAATAQKLSEFCQAGSKGFGSPNILKFLSIPQFDPNNPEHLKMSEFGASQRLLFI